MKSSEVVHILLIIATCLAYIVTVAFNGLAGAVYRPLFVSGPGQIQNQTRSEIDPAGWTFSVWGVIYAWQALWILHTVVSICLPGVVRDAGSLYRNPTLTPPILLAIYICNLGGNVGWLFLFDRQYFIAANIVLVLIALSLYLMIAISIRATLENSDKLVTAQKRYHVILIVGLLQNGLGIYAGWTTVATMLNVNISLIYRSTVGVAVSGTVALSILSFCLLVYVVMDQTVFTRSLRFVITPYAVWTWALIGVVANNHQSLPGRNAIFNVVLLVFCACALVFKVIATVVRQRANPIYAQRKVEATKG